MKENGSANGWSFELEVRFETGAYVLLLRGRYFRAWEWGEHYPLREGQEQKFPLFFVGPQFCVGGIASCEA